MKIRTLLLTSMLFFMLTFMLLINSWIRQPCGKQLPDFDFYISASEANYSGKTINVLLLAYSRSGSSFAGELLSSADDVFYVFEPSLEFALKRHIEDVNSTVEILDGIYNCRKETFDMLAIKHVGEQGAPFYFPKVPMGINDIDYLVETCNKARVRIIKTIRMSMKTAHQLMLAKPSLNLAIVHLVRDPRGIINSMNKKEKGFWAEDFKEKIYNCDNLRSDLKNSENIPEGHYVRVRYEDLSTKTVETAVRVFESIGLPITNSLACYILEHVQRKYVKFIDFKEKYFSTYRTRHFDPNQWKSSMKLEDIQGIEAECKDVFVALNYEFYRDMKITDN